MLSKEALEDIFLVYDWLKNGVFFYFATKARRYKMDGVLPFDKIMYPQAALVNLKLSCREEEPTSSLVPNEIAV